MFSKNIQTSSFMKIRPEVTDFLTCGQNDGQADRRTHTHD
jgi:methyl coenzyme M reductase subunit D